MSDLFDADGNYISRSELKREAQELQVLGEQLLLLPENNYRTLDLPSNLSQAIDIAKNIKSHNALRRQHQLIGKIMRKVDDETLVDIRAAIKAFQAGNKLSNLTQKRLENTREQLIAGDKALLEKLSQKTDANALLALVREAQNEHEQNSHGRAYKKLFQVLKPLLND